MNKEDQNVQENQNKKENFSKLQRSNIHLDTNLTLIEKMNTFPSATNYQNYKKNRYLDILANEGSRVKIYEIHRSNQESCGNISFDTQHTTIKNNEKKYRDENYINANYINCEDHKSNNMQRFIATQAPIKEYFDDFLTMLWEQESKIIITFGADKEKDIVKMYPYWLKEEEEKEEENNSVFKYYFKNINSDINESGFVVRKLFLTNLTYDMKREIIHIHFPDWIDGKSTNKETVLAIMQYMDKVLDEEKELTGPPVIHCSAGIGRTGTYIATYYAIQLIKQNQKPNIYNIVERIRKDRYGLVQTEDQYLFIYELTKLFEKELSNKN
jgi:protein tyrosine phosphatase